MVVLTGLETTHTHKTRHHSCAGSLQLYFGSTLNKLITNNSSTGHTFYVSATRTRVHDSSVYKVHIIIIIIIIKGIYIAQVRKGHKSL